MLNADFGVYLSKKILKSSGDRWSTRRIDFEFGWWNRIGIGFHRRIWLVDLSTFASRPTDNLQLKFQLDPFKKIRESSAHRTGHGFGRYYGCIDGSCKVHCIHKCLLMLNVVFGVHLAQKNAGILSRSTHRIDLEFSCRTGFDRRISLFRIPTIPLRPIDDLNRIWTVLFELDLIIPNYRPHRWSDLEFVTLLQGGLSCAHRMRCTAGYRKHYSELS